MRSGNTFPRSHRLWAIHRHRLTRIRPVRLRPIPARLHIVTATTHPISRPSRRLHSGPRTTLGRIENDLLLCRRRISGTAVAALPPEYQPERAPAKELPPQFRRTVVDYPTVEPPGTIIIDTPNTYLYLTIGHGKAIRYGIGVGREGFTWSGTEHISRMKEWPDWLPPKEMIKRQPYLPRFMAGGETNPLGARAMYLGNTEYRIHGTNQPSTIGSFVSSGCIRLTNEDVEDLYSRVTVGTTVVVLPGANTAASQLRPRY